MIILAFSLKKNDIFWGSSPNKHAFLHLQKKFEVQSIAAVLRLSTNAILSHILAL